MTASGCLVAFYHYVRDVGASPYPDLKALPSADFQAQLDWLARARTVIDYSTFDEHLLTRCALQNTALLTFDDGLVDHYTTVFPALKDRGWSGVFFLVGQTLGSAAAVSNVHKTHFLIAKLGAGAFTGAVRRALAVDRGDDKPALTRHGTVYRYDETADSDVKHLLNYELPFDVADRILAGLFGEHFGDETAFARQLYLSPAMIAEMAAAHMTFGFHTERHRVLSRLSIDGQRQELALGVARIRELTGQRAVPFCYPYGHPHTYNEDTRTILADTGYSCAFSTNRRCADVTDDPRFDIPRFDTRDLPPFTPAATYA